MNPSKSCPQTDNVITDTIHIHPSMAYCNLLGELFYNTTPLLLCINDSQNKGPSWGCLKSVHEQDQSPHRRPSERQSCDYKFVNSHTI